MYEPGCQIVTCDARMPAVVLEPVAFRRHRENAYSIENPQYPLDDPSIWSEGATSASGERITPCKILHVPAAFQAVTRISGDIARCPLELWEENDGVWKRLANDPLDRLTSIQPNREMDAFTFWQQVYVHRLVYQNAYIFIVLDHNGAPAELLPLLPDRTEPKRAGGIKYFQTEVDGNLVDVPASRVIHLQGIGFDGLKAYELVKAMREAWGLAIGQMKFAAKVFRSGGRSGGVLEIPVGMPKTGADRLEEGFRKKYDDANGWFSTVVLRDGAKFHEAQMTLRESQSVEGRKETVRDVARAFNIRPGNLGEGENGVYKSKYEDTRDYLDMTLRPLMAGSTSQCRVKLLSRERQGRTQFEHNTDDLLQMSPKEQFEAYGSGVEATLITSNEGRAKLGYPPHPDGDKLRSPHTQSSKRGGDPKVKPKADPPADVDVDEEDLENAHARLQAEHAALVRNNVADVVAVIGEQAVRAAAAGGKFIAWLDEKLPAKRGNLVRAGLPTAAADKYFDELNAGLQQIASSKPQPELRDAVTNFFQTWEFSQ